MEMQHEPGAGKSGSRKIEDARTGREIPSLSWHLNALAVEIPVFTCILRRVVNDS
jgi:hypothetical protein